MIYVLEYQLNTKKISSCDNTINLLKIEISSDKYILYSKGLCSKVKFNRATL